MGAGLLLLAFSGYLLIPKDRTTSGGENSFTVTASQARTAPDHMTTVSAALSSRTTTATSRDARPSDVILGTIVGFGTLLVIAGAFFYRGFNLALPGGTTLTVAALATLVTKLAQTTKAKGADYLLANHKAVSEFIASTLGERQPRGRFRAAVLRGTSPGDELDSLVSEKVDELVDKYPKPD
jgi:hypothetical protein